MDIRVLSEQCRGGTAVGVSPCGQNPILSIGIGDRATVCLPCRRKAVVRALRFRQRPAVQVHNTELPVWVSRNIEAESAETELRIAASTRGTRKDEACAIRTDLRRQQLIPAKYRPLCRAVAIADEHPARCVPPRKGDSLAVRRPTRIEAIRDALQIGTVSSNRVNVPAACILKDKLAIDGAGRDGGCQRVGKNKRRRRRRCGSG